MLSVQRREKGSKTRTAVPFSKIVKLYNSSMGGVDLMDQHTAAYRLDRKTSVKSYLCIFFDLMDVAGRKSSVRFYLCIFFDLMDIACVNSYLIHNMKYSNQFSLLDYKIIVAKNLMQYHQGRKRTVPMSRTSKRNNQPESIDNHGGHLPDYQTMRKQYAYCAMESKEIEHSSSVWLVTFHYA